MPELPDLEVFSANLDKQFKGKVLENIEVTVTRKLNVPVADLKEKLEGHKLLSVKRNGKSLLLDFGDDRKLGLHLMLHGELKLKQEGQTHRFPIIAFDFADGSGFSMNDFQKAATTTLNPTLPDVPDAFTIKKEDFVNLLAGKKTEVKSILLDQKFIRGVGNAYADEILWEARISPFSPSHAIPTKRAEELYEAMQRVLKNAVKEIRKVNPDQLSGEVRDFLSVHHSKKTQSPTGAEILTRKTGGRITYYTEEQELFKLK